MQSGEKFTIEGKLLYDYCIFSQTSSYCYILPQWSFIQGSVFGLMCLNGYVFMFVCLLFIGTNFKKGIQ